MKWFWADDKRYPYTEKEWKEETRILFGVKYNRELIPETGLGGHYCGQGDIKWAWVREV